MKNKLVQILMIICLVALVASCNDSKTGSESAAEGNDFLVTIKTDLGEMKAVLYDETPLHKANFLKLSREGFFDSLAFHRVMKDFMIQGGDPESKNATMDQRLGSGGPGYTVPAEFLSSFYHHKGALSAARQPDQVNPEKASSGSQFFIVQGFVSPRAQLEGPNNQLIGKALQELRQNQPNHALNAEFQQAFDSLGNQGFQDKVMSTLDRLSEATGITFSMSEDKIEKYSTVGGYPPLDGDYTVFGEVISGLEVIDAIAAVEVRNPQQEDRPFETIRMYISVEEMSRADIQDKYGYTYPKAAINQ